MTDEHRPDDETMDEVPAEPLTEPSPYADADGVADVAQSARRASDPVVTVLLTTALALIAVLLATGALIFVYLNTLNDAPRTRIERDLATWEVAVKERPDDLNAWARLAYAYAEARRTDEALETVARAKKVTGRSQLVIVEADVLRLGGRYSEAVKAYDAAEKAVREIQQEVEADRKKVGVTVDPDRDALARVFYGRALSRQELGDTIAAVKDLEEAVKLAPQSATMWVALGDLYERSEDTSAADKAYRKALTFVPDEPGALDGLDRLEKRGD